MRIIKVKKDQSLADIALQEYGHVEGVFFLVEDNATLIGITDNIYEGDQLIIREEQINAPMQTFLADYIIATAKGARGCGIGYWTIGVDFEVQPSPDFNNDFNNDFLNYGTNC